MLGGREFQTKVVGRSQQGTERGPVCPAHGVGWSVSSRVAAGTRAGWAGEEATQCLK